MDELPGGLLRVTMPLPTRPGHVHCYLVPVEDGLMLVDTGLGLPDAREQWADVLAGVDAPIVTTFLTHFHPDHLGAAADVRELTGSRVVQGRLDAEQARTVWDNEDWTDHLADWFHRNGVPANVTDELIGQGVRYKPFVRTVPDPEVVDPGDTLHGWDLVAAPGHADGQLTLLRDGVLLAADHLSRTDHADGGALAGESPRSSRRLPQRPGADDRARPHGRLRRSRRCDGRSRSAGPAS